MSIISNQRVCEAPVHEDGTTGLVRTSQCVRCVRLHRTAIARTGTWSKTLCQPEPAPCDLRCCNPGPVEMFTIIASGVVRVA